MPGEEQTNERLERLETYQRNVGADIEMLEKAIQEVRIAQKEFAESVKNLEGAFRAVGQYLRETVGRQTFTDDKGNVVWFPENPLLFPKMETAREYSRGCWACAHPEIPIEDVWQKREGAEN